MGVEDGIPHVLRMTSLVACFTDSGEGEKCTSLGLNCMLYTVCSTEYTHAELLRYGLHCISNAMFYTVLYTVCHALHFYTVLQCMSLMVYLNSTCLYFRVHNNISF